METKKRSGIVTWEALQESIRETINSIPPIRIIYGIDRPSSDLLSNGGKGIGVVGTDNLENEVKDGATGGQLASKP